MKAELTFDLPDEEYLFECAINGAEIVSDLRELKHTVHSSIKHGHNYETIDEVLEMVWDEISVILLRIKSCG